MNSFKTLLKVMRSVLYYVVVPQICSGIVGVNGYIGVGIGAVVHIVEQYLKHGGKK